MSLTSRISNLFTTSTKHSQDGNGLTFVDDGLSDTNAGAQHLGSRPIMAQDADEVEARPPYLHVSVAVEA